MRPEEAVQTARALNSLIEFDGGGSWDHIDMNALRTWGGQVLSRLTAAVGTESIELGSGYVTEDPSIHGDVAIFTETRLVRATFEVVDGQLGPTRIRSLPRSAVKAFNIIDSSHYDNDRDPWPTRFRVEVVVEGDDVFPLPLSRWTTSSLSAIQEFVAAYFTASAT